MPGAAGAPPPPPSMTHTPDAAKLLNSLAPARKASVQMRRIPIADKIPKNMVEMFDVQIL